MAAAISAPLPVKMANSKEIPTIPHQIQLITMVQPPFVVQYAWKAGKCMCKSNKK
jgi:hypothetical protein